MSQETIRFELHDFTETVAAEGPHAAVIHSARFRTSESGNGTLQVVYHLSDASPGCDRVSEYFVIDGADARALAIARRRLLGLCRACGLKPEQRGELRPSELLGQHVKLRVGHEWFHGSRRARVLGYLPLGA